MVSERELRFELLVPAPVADVAQWHRQVLAARAFTPVGETKTESGGIALAFYRAGLDYQVRIEPEEGDASRVYATLALRDAAAQ